jgi:hypothetical protein
MANVNKFSEQLIDVAERFADVVDATQGKGARKGGIGARWLILPAAGAAAYALVTSGSSLARQTRGLMRRAKDRATDLPDADLFARVKEASGRPAQKTNTGSQGQSQRRRTNRTQRRRTTASAR